MTVSTTLNKQIFQGNASNTTFSFSFAFPGGTATQEGAEIQVFYTDTFGNITQLIQGPSSSNYQIVFNAPISPDPTPVGGTVTYNPPGGPIGIGTTLTVYRNLPLTQTTSYANQGTFYPSAFEQSLDYQLMVSQQVLEVQSRALVVPISDPVPNPLPAAGARAGQLLGFDANGNPIAVASSGGGSSGVTSFAGRTGLVTPQAGDYTFGLLSGNIAVSQMASGTGAAANTYWNGLGAWTQVNFNQLAGNIAVSQMNSGIGASAASYWNGTGTWVTIGNTLITWTQVQTYGAAHVFTGSSSGSFSISASSIGSPQYGGTATNDNAPAGDIGEYIQSTVAVGSAVALTTGVAANVTSIPLTAGDWEVYFLAAFTGGGTTTVSNLNGYISTSSAGTSTAPGQFYSLNTFGQTALSGFNPTITVGPVRLSLPSTTTVFAVVLANFGTSTCSAYGQIRARRPR